MESKELHEALGELEINLKNLDASRKQVDRVTDSSEKLTLNVERLVEGINNLHDKLEKETFRELSNAINDFSKILKDYNYQIETLLNNSSSEINKQIITIKSNSDNFSKQTDEIISNFVSVSNQTIKKQDKSLSVITNDFKLNVSAQINKFEKHVLTKLENSIVAKIQEYEHEHIRLKKLLLGALGSCGLALIVIIFLIKN
ncbi:MAG: hypothetical protein KAI81_05205 [Candidatus Marinimicrobia bacterium]|nr:hypothetical protein [Candidatus Neomarinimicrobiota bacterium]